MEERINDLPGLVGIAAGLRKREPFLLRGQVCAIRRHVVGAADTARQQ